MAKKITHEEFCSNINRIYNGKFTVITEYINTRSDVTLKCNTCGEHKTRKANMLISSPTRCLKCSKYKNYTTEEVRVLIEDKFGDEYLLIGDYINAKTRIKLMHNSKMCNFNTYEVTFNNLYNNNRMCRICSLKKSGVAKSKEFSNEFKIFMDNCKSYNILDEPVNAKHKIRFEPLDCNHEIFYMTPDKFKQGQRCPSCKSSKGERLISNILDSINIRYVREAKFDDCIYENKLRFDFYIEERLLIEFHGKQHYEPVEFWGGEEGFGLNKIRDEIKLKYCDDKSIPLLVIPYWEINNIDKILTDFLNSNLY